MNIQTLLDTARKNRADHAALTEIIDKQLSVRREQCQRERKPVDSDPEYQRLQREKNINAAKIPLLDESIASLEREINIDLAMDSLSREVHPTGVTLPGADQRLEVSGGDRQYRADDSRMGRPSFLRDLYDAQVRRDPAANERLAQHGREVERADSGWAQRAVNTGAVSGFVPPAYLTDLWAELARAGRPVADLCTRLPLPDVGMTVNIPRVTTGTTTSVQTAENATVGNQDLDDTLLTVNVVTIAGYTDVSRQAIERGVGVEQLVLADLAADYNSKLDAQVINGSGSSGQALGILGTSGITTITYTDATPTVAEIYPKIADAVRQVVSQRFTGPTAIVMSPLEWGWIVGQLDSTGRPLVDVNGTGQNAFGIAASPQYPGSVGTMLGVPVYVSGNVPANLGAGTNETRIIAADFRDLVLFEDNNGAPVQLRFDEPVSSALGVRLLAYGYSAFSAGRQPKAVSVVAGTGLITPSL